MTTFPATEAKNRFGELLEAVHKEPAKITKKGRAVAVVLSIEDYSDMKRRLGEEEQSTNLEWLDVWLEKCSSIPREKALDEDDYSKHLDEKYGQ